MGLVHFHCFKMTKKVFPVLNADWNTGSGCLEVTLLGAGFQQSQQFPDGNVGGVPTDLNFHALDDVLLGLQLVTEKFPRRSFSILSLPGAGRFVEVVFNFRAFTVLCPVVAVITAPVKLRTGTREDKTFSGLLCSLRHLFPLLSYATM